MRSSRWCVDPVGGYDAAMTTEPDPSEIVPTNNSAGAPVDESALEQIEQEAADDAQSDPPVTGG